MSLESGYKRLLSLYPPAYLREYGEEMLGVLLAGSRPGQLRPSVRDALDVVTSVMTVRWRFDVRSLRGDRWRRTAWVVQIFGGILLSAISLRRFAVGGLGWIVDRPSGYVLHFSLELEGRAVAWLAMLACALAGRRVAAVACATAATAAEIGIPGQYYVDTPAVFLDVYWIVLMAVSTVLASFVAHPAVRRVPGWAFRLSGRRGDAGRPAPVRQRRPPVPRGTVAVALAGLTLIASAGGGMLPTPLVLNNEPRTLIMLACLVVTALFLVVGAWRLEPPIRRRLVVCAVPVVAAIPLVRIGFGDLIEANASTVEAATLPGPLPWLSLVVIPAAAFHWAATVNRRYERSHEQEEAATFGQEAT